jgi:hypothetical protein
MPDALETLRRANPRAESGFTQTVDVTAERLRAELLTATPQRKRRLVPLSAAGALLAAGAVVAALTFGSPSGGPGVENAAAEVKKAASVTASSAEHSGTAVVRMTHNGQLWAGKTVRWNAADMSITEDTPGRGGRPGGELRVVDRMLYAPDLEGDGWVVLGRPENIDPDSGTTPDEQLAAVREDVGGMTLRRIIGGLSGLTTDRLDDGSTVYRGTIAAGQIARESGFKEGQAIRVLPFGYVAHDEAADPAAPLDTAVTVGADGIVREIAVTWGTAASAWTYTVTYSDLGTTAAPVAPPNARPLKRKVPASPGS